MVHILFGKICSGKSTYARSTGKIVFDVDELMNRIDDKCEGKKRHNEIAMAIVTYYLEKIIELDKKGIDTVLDYGFWYEEERRYIKEVLDEEGIAYRFIEFVAPENVRRKRLIERNKTSKRPIDPDRLATFDSWFEGPVDEEYSIWNTK